MPALIAVGAREMPDFTQAASSLSDAIPGARRVTIEGAGHLAPMEAPHAFREPQCLRTDAPRLGFLS